MAWIVLVVSALFEAVWANALDRIDGLSPGPIAVFVLGSTVSLGGLWWAMKEIPVGTAYAVWVGIGVAATVGYAWGSGAEPFSLLRLGFILGIVACVLGLKLSH